MKRHNQELIKYIFEQAVYLTGAVAPTLKTQEDIGLYFSNIYIILRQRIYSELGVANEFGILPENASSDKFITCLECGEKFSSISSHVNACHKISFNEYKEKHKLPRSFKASVESLRKKQADTLKKLKPWENVERVKNKKKDGER